MHKWEQGHQKAQAPIKAVALKLLNSNMQQVFGPSSLKDYTMRASATRKKEAGYKEAKSTLMIPRDKRDIVQRVALGG